MYTLSAFRRRLVSGEASREVQLEAGQVSWLPAQRHHGENIGETETHVLFVELKEVLVSGSGSQRGLGPQAP